MNHDAIDAQFDVNDETNQHRGIRLSCIPDDVGAVFWNTHEDPFGCLLHMGEDHLVLCMARYRWNAAQRIRLLFIRGADPFDRDTHQDSLPRIRCKYANNRPCTGKRKSRHGMMILNTELPETIWCRCYSIQFAATSLLCCQPCSVNSSRARS